ncbi:MAG: hypothetical protein NT129_00270 [Candidatus Aenigmarchaeota archaeon]|nr:hypothetical protein [Candidatus Aenigmarchaeota archaeon]
MVMEFCRRLEDIGFEKGEGKSTGYVYPRIVEYDKLRDLAVYLNVVDHDIRETVNVLPQKDGTFEVICLMSTHDDDDASPSQSYLAPMGFGVGRFRSYEEPLDDGARAIKAGLSR